MTKPNRPKRVRETFESSAVWGEDIHGKPVEVVHVGSIVLEHPCWRVGDRVRVTVERIEPKGKGKR